MEPNIVALSVGATRHGFAALCQMEEGAVFRLLGGGIPGHSTYYRIHGTRGAAEITRGPGYFGAEQVRVWHDPWDTPPNSSIHRSRAAINCLSCRMLISSHRDDLSPIGVGLGNDRSIASFCSAVNRPTNVAKGLRFFRYFRIASPSSKRMLSSS